MTFRGRRQGGNPRCKTCGTSVTVEEMDSVLQALEQGGFHHPSDAIRKILFAYRDSVSVRDAIANHLSDLAPVA